MKRDSLLAISYLSYNLSIPKIQQGNNVFEAKLSSHPEMAFWPAE